MQQIMVNDLKFHELKFLKKKKMAYAKCADPDQTAPKKQFHYGF